jgi:hypothetical protein
LTRGPETDRVLERLQAAVVLLLEEDVRDRRALAVLVERDASPSIFMPSYAYTADAVCAAWWKRCSYASRNALPSGRS